VLIHLINMLRHRRVDWAAMEFLLVSQRKHRTWIILKQLLLLLLRIIAVSAVALMVAQPVLHSQWGNLLGTTRTHHVLLLDDSFSMSDRWGDTSAFAQAKAVVGRIAAAAARETQPQSMTLLRFSRVDCPGVGTQADLANQPLGRDFPAKLAEQLKTMEVSQTAAEPLPALAALDSLLHDAEGERRIVYLISDFRTRQWDKPTELKKRLAQLSAAGADLRLIDCVRTARPNLAITSLEPSEGIRAAKVEWFMEVGVQNFGPTTVKDVSVLLSQDNGAARGGLAIAEIPPYEVVKEKFRVDFLTAGQHFITARLDRDAVETDNSRYAVVDLPAEVPVLLVDGDPGADDAGRLAVALAPGGQVVTGLKPQIEMPSFLAARPLERFQSICVANVDRLDRAAVAALEQYVRGGGGLAFFLGPRSDDRFINEALYRHGEGLFPLPVAGPTELLVDRLEKAPDMEVDVSHPIFSVFAENRNSFLGTVLVERYFAAAAGWRPPRGAAARTRVLARLRNGDPLVVERSFGKGRVVAFLTTAAPTWNNWARNNPTFVVAMLQLQAYLTGRPDPGAARRVGAPLEVSFSSAEYQRQVRFITPMDDSAAAVDALAGSGGQWLAAFPATDRSGFYEARLTNKITGKSESRRWAVNVDAAEGDLRALFGEELAARLQPEVHYQFAPADTFEMSVGQQAGYNLGESLLYLLVALLIGEQILAWSASYHPPARAAATAAAGRVRASGGAL
jgi:hypothetical protein